MALVLTGVGVASTAMLAGVNGLAFAIGVYLPLASIAPIFVGGCVRGLVELSCRAASEKEDHAGAGTLAASGLVAGEGLAGVAIAVHVGGFNIGHRAAPRVGGPAGQLAALSVVVLVAVFLARAGMKRPPA